MYASLKDETPRLIAIKADVDLWSLLSLNADRVPGLEADCGLPQGTLLIFDYIDPEPRPPKRGRFGGGKRRAR